MPIALVVWIPWAGIERLWYARAFTGGTVTIADVPRLFLRLFGRFLRLLLLVAVPVGGVIVALAWFSRDSGSGQLSWFGLAILGTALTFTLTFVLPALTFSTTRVRSALRTGVSMIRSTWPASAPYLLVPALVPVPLTMAGSLDLPPPWAVILNLLGTLLELLFVGATTRFFVRQEWACPWMRSVSRTTMHERAAMFLGSLSTRTRFSGLPESRTGPHSESLDVVVVE